MKISQIVEILKENGKIMKREIKGKEKGKGETWN